MIQVKVEDTPTAVVYPRLRKSEGMIVLFTSEGAGIVVASDASSNPIGTFSDEWYPSAFKDFTGSVTISNS